MKSGITLAQKNMVGIIGAKNSLVHYRVGPPPRGGDEFPDKAKTKDFFLRRFNRMYEDLLLSRNTGTNSYRLFVKSCGGQRNLGGAVPISSKPNLIHSGHWYGNNPFGVPFKM